MNNKLIKIIIPFLIGLYACSTQQTEESPEPEAYSIDQKPLYKIELSGERKQQFESNLQQAYQDYLESPEDEERIIWYGRRLAYLMRYREAIDIYSKGLVLWPESYKLLRHRGHRYITTRQFDRAIEDLNRAAELCEGMPVEMEPDGLPNRLNIPLSNTQFNIWYHLGLANYLKGDYQNAAESYRRCMEFSDNNDLLVATSDWYYMTLRRIDNQPLADSLLMNIRPDMEIIENDSYFKRLLMYKGLYPPDSLLTIDSTADDPALVFATQGYGVGNWHLINGNRKKAKEIFQRVVAGDNWAAFGYIAAEMDLVRLFQQADR